MLVQSPYPSSLNLQCCRYNKLKLIDAWVKIIFNQNWKQCKCIVSFCNLLQRIVNSWIVTSSASLWCICPIPTVGVASGPRPAYFNWKTMTNLNSYFCYILQITEEMWSDYLVFNSVFLFNIPVKKKMKKKTHTLYNHALLNDRDAFWEICR